MLFSHNFLYNYYSIPISIIIFLVDLVLKTITKYTLSVVGNNLWKLCIRFDVVIFWDSVNFARSKLYYRDIEERYRRL